MTEFVRKKTKAFYKKQEEEEKLLDKIDKWKENIINNQLTQENKRLSKVRKIKLPKSDFVYVYKKKK